MNYYEDVKTKYLDILKKNGVEDRSTVISVLNTDRELFRKKKDTYKSRLETKQFQPIDAKRDALLKWIMISLILDLSTIDSYTLSRAIDAVFQTIDGFDNAFTVIKEYTNPESELRKQRLSS